VSESNGEVSACDNNDELKREMRPAVSILLPVYNEAEVISDIVKTYHGEICSRLPTVLIVAEDGSTDGTKEILASLKSDVPMVLLSDHNRKGYAKSVSDALKICSGDWVFFSDSDGQYSPSDFWRLWEHRNSYDMIIGRKVRRSEGMYRTILAKGFHGIVNGLFGLDLHDADCGFRLIRREVIRSVIDEVEFLKYSFWTEFTIRACLRGFRIREVPISHSSRSHGNTHIYNPSKIPMIILKQLRGLGRLYADVKNGY
jgi:glycosyltransferase involved in cell wall biosynthesis